jgi:hypothetical protein
MVAQVDIRLSTHAVDRGEVEQDISQHLQANIRVSVAVIPAANNDSFPAAIRRKGGTIDCLDYGFIGLSNLLWSSGGKDTQLIPQPFAVCGVGPFGGKLRIAAYD